MKYNEIINEKIKNSKKKLTFNYYYSNIMRKKGEMKMKNFKVFISSFMAAITLGSGMTVSAEEKNANKETSYVYIYNNKKDLKKDYNIDEPIELIMPISVNVSDNGNQSYEYGTIIVENDKKSINPRELVNVMNAMQILNDKKDANKFVYYDINKSQSTNFKIKTLTKNLTEKQLMSYIERQNQTVEKSKKTVDHGQYAEFMLPVMGSYLYKNSKGKTAIYRQIEYIYFYIPYDMITNDINFSNIATLAYERYQSSFDHVITYKELQKEDSNHKNSLLVKTK